MYVNVQVTLQSGDDWTLTPAEAASAILTALAGDESKDVAAVLVTGSATVGTPPMPEPAPTSPVPPPIAP